MNDPYKMVSLSLPEGKFHSFVEAVITICNAFIGVLSTIKKQKVNVCNTFNIKQF
jgi:hypothetical protein